MIASGRTVKQIAGDIALSVKTVSTIGAGTGEDGDENQRRVDSLRSSDSPSGLKRSGYLVSRHGRP